MATHCQSMWRQRGAVRRWSCIVHSRRLRVLRRSEVCEADRAAGMCFGVFISHVLPFSLEQVSLQFCNRPGNLVPALKKNTVSTFEHSYCSAKMALFWALVGKSSSISKYYSHKLWKFALLLTTALILSVKNGYSINWYLRSKCHVQFEVNTDHDCRSRWHFGAGLCCCAKRACTLLSIY